MSEIRHEPEARTVAWRLPGGHRIDRHRHDHHQIVYASAGVLAVETVAGSWVASRDRAVWLPAGTWHAHRFYGASSFHTVGFPTDPPPLAHPGPMIVPVTPLLRELLIACADPHLAAAELGRVRAVIYDRLARAPHEPISLPAAQDPRLAEACAIAADQLADSHSLAALASRVGASERTLSRLFRDELGMTYPQWRTNIRLLNAMVLLSGGASVTATALGCGWNTTSSFIDAFRRAMGQTPGVYRTTAATELASPPPVRPASSAGPRPIRAPAGSAGAPRG